MNADAQAVFLERLSMTVSDLPLRRWGDTRRRAAMNYKLTKGQVRDLATATTNQLSLWRLL